MKQTLLAAVLLVVVMTGCVGKTSEERSFTTTTTTAATTVTVQQTAEKKEKAAGYGDLEKSHFSRVGEVKNATWVRFWVTWQAVEPERGRYDFSFLDNVIRHFQASGACVLITVEPFANWDQDRCHGEEYWGYMPLPWGKGKIKVGKPCSMDDYRKFLRKLVERYDGDGIDDMPGLRYPVKYWEIMNEPEMQGKGPHDPKFFVGSPEDYLDILKVSYGVIKDSDPDAKVVMGGMSSMMDKFVEFWDPIIAEASRYFDIANVHSIDTTEEREDLYMLKFRQFLEKHGVMKPIWITEVQYDGLWKPSEDLSSIDKLLVRSTVFSIALGAEKLFYIDNWLVNWKSQSTQRAYETLVKKLAYFDRVEVIRQEYVKTPEGARTTVGQYRFEVGNRTVYVLWGKAPLPEEIGGRVKVTDIYGNVKIMDAENVQLTDSPIYLELLNN